VRVISGLGGWDDSIATTETIDCRRGHSLAGLPANSSGHGKSHVGGGLITADGRDNTDRLSAALVELEASGSEM
jgi:hypothetical protein